MFPHPPYKRGQFVKIDYNGQSVKAMVTLASANGRSLMLMFEGALRTPGDGLLVNAMAVLYEDGSYKELAEGAAVTLTLAVPDAG